MYAWMWCNCTVHRDGSSKCGTLLTLVVSLARLRDAQTVDVLQTVRGMRAQRQGCVPSEVSKECHMRCKARSQVSMYGAVWPVQRS